MAIILLFLNSLFASLSAANFIKSWCASYRLNIIRFNFLIFLIFFANSIFMIFHFFNVN